MELIMETNPEFERYKKASKKVEELKGFYGHLITFVLVNAAIMGINLYFSPKYLWFFWVVFGWGIGLFFHAMKIFNFFPFMNKDWEEKKIKQFMEEEKRKNTNIYN